MAGNKVGFESSGVEAGDLDLRSLEYIKIYFMWPHESVVIDVCLSAYFG